MAKLILDEGPHLVLEEGPRLVPDEPDKIGYWEAAKEKPSKFIPFAGTLAEVEQISFIVKAGRRLAKNKYGEPPAWAKGWLQREAQRKGYPKWTPQIQKQEDIKIIEDFLEDVAEKERRGYSLLGHVGRITSEMPALLFEFLATGGLQQLGKIGAKKIGKKILRKYAATAAGKAALATGGFATGTALRAAGMPARAAKAVLKRQVPQDIKISEKGVEIKGPVEKPFTSIWKGLADHYIEVASEQAGEVITPGIGKAFKKIPFMGKFTSELQNRWLKLHPAKKAVDFTKKIATKAGFHGVVGEIGEEYLGDVTRAITDVEHFGAGEDANMMERISAGVRADTEALPAMAISFTITGGTLKGVSLTQAARYKKVSLNKLVDSLNLPKEIKAEVKEGLLGITPLSEIKTPSQIETAEGIIGFEDEFELKDPPKEFRKPGAGKACTSKWLLNRIIGAELMLEDVDKAAVAKGLEQQHLNTWVRKIENQLKKQATLGDRTASRLLKQPTKPIARMRDLLDSYEEAPDWMKPEDARIFNQCRELLRYLRDRANIVRKRMGLEPIKNVKEYITHWIDATSRYMIEKRGVSLSVAANELPQLQSGYLYYLMQGLPKDIKNPTAETRKVKGELEKYFSKDLGALLRAMINWDLREIHIKEPYEAAWAELQDLRKKGLIPETAAEEIAKYLRYDIRKFQDSWDSALDVTLKTPTDLINKLLLPLNRMITSPTRQILQPIRWYAHLAGLGFRPRPITRNLAQKMLLLDFFRASDIAKAQFAPVPMVEHPITGEQVNLLELIREQDWYKASLHKYLEVDTAIRGVQKAALTPYSKTHIGNRFLSNVEISALTGYYDWLHRRNQSKNVNSKHFKNCVKEAKKLGINTIDLLTQDGDMMWSIREAVRRTQWEYMSISMPACYRGEFKKSMLIFQSWWMNYFFNHCRECINQIATGRNSQGRLLTPRARLRTFKGMGTLLAISKALKTVFGITMLKYMFMPAPGYLPPIPELVIGIIQLFVADDDKERKAAKSRIKYACKFWIPFSAAWRDINRLFSGEYDIADYIFYRKEKGK